MGSTKATEGPNALTVGILFVLLGLSALSTAVHGPATLIVLAAVLGFFAVMWMLSVGWQDAPRRARVAASPTPRAPARRRSQPAPLARGRVVTRPQRVAPTPTG